MKKITIILAIVLSNAAFGQGMLTFRNCLDLAIKNNLDLKTAENNQQIAKYQYRASYGKLLPSLIASVDDKNSWGRDINPKTNTITELDIKNYVGILEAGFNLFSGFSVWNSIKSSKLEYQINQSALLKVKNLITIDLAQKFITILYLEDVIVANQEQIKSSENQLELAILKFNSGVIAESEVFKIKSQKATEELNLLTNQNHLTDNVIGLKQLMNVPLNQEITLIKPILNLDKNLIAETNPFEITQKAVLLHPAYSISLLREQKARKELAIARSLRYPTLTMRMQARSNYSNVEPLVTFQDQIDRNYSTVLRFNLSIPIFSQFETFARVKTSKLNYKQSKINVEIAQNQLSKEVLKAITDTKTAVKRKESSAVAFEFSQKSYDADVLKFELGKININELNTTKMMYNSSQAELIQSKYELLFNNALIQFYLGEEFSL